jgi:glycosyltransferase involved in cell wall biosynthesis
MARNVAVFDVNNLEGFSGIPKNLVRALEAQPRLKVSTLNFRNMYRPTMKNRIMKRVGRAVTGRHYLWEKEPRRCRHISAELDKLILKHNPDAVLMFGSEGCAFSRTETPIYCFADSIFGSRTDLYDDQKDISRSSVAHGKLVQQLALDRLQKLFISSQWAVDHANEKFNYVLDPSKVRVVGIGANLPAAIYGHQPASIEFSNSHAEFLWVGVDWERKGGPFAIKVIAALRELGINTRLHVVGPVVPSAQHEWVIRHGLLIYDRPADFSRLKAIFDRCCAMLLPSNADLTPIAIAECYAFGRPVFATPIGGIGEMVIGTQTGLTIASNTPADWAASILKFFHNRSRIEIAENCRNLFVTEFNWDSVAQQIAGDISGQ